MKIELPLKTFVNSPVALAEKLTGDELRMDLFDRVEYSETGIEYAFYKHLRFPKKGLPLASVVEMVGIPKRLLVSFLRILTIFPFNIGLLIFLILSKKRRRKIIFLFLYHFNRVSDWALSRYYRTAEVYPNCIREIHDKVSKWIDKNFTSDVSKSEKKFSYTEYPKIGVSIGGFPSEKEILYETLRIFCLMMSDNAYRHRFQDLASEINKEALKKNPAKELCRILDIAIGRERATGLPNSKWRPIKKLIKWGLRLSPKSATIIVEIISELNLERVELKDIDWDTAPQFSEKNQIGFDHIDWYDVLNNVSYDYGGYNLKERFELRRKIDMPHLQKVNQELMKNAG